MFIGHRPGVYVPLRALFLVSYMDSSLKNSFPVFFSCPNYHPLPSYAPFKG